MEWDSASHLGVSPAEDENDFLSDAFYGPSNPFQQDPMTQQQQQQQQPEEVLYEKIRSARRHGIFPWHVSRAAAGDGAPKEIYYGALSVAVLTLGLLLFVEACRRWLDRSAVHRPIFQAVLDGVYRELATLGIVELFIHLMHEYYDDLDVAAEAVFVDVHFVLFYTAIFNAIFSALLAAFAHHVSRRIWVRTEELELNHYVEIREEFDLIRSKLFGISGQSKRKSIIEQQNNSLSTNIKNISNSFQQSTYEFYDSSGRSCLTSLKKFGMGIFYGIKYPRMKQKHDKLLIQVRFHELRVHFLQAYDLPLKLKISTYLMKSEQHVLKHLIHVSTSAWLWLTGLTCALYYISGVIVNWTDDVASSGLTLTACFFSGMVLFIVASLWLYRSLNSVFYQIMEGKELWDIHDNQDNQSIREGADAEVAVGGDDHLETRTNNTNNHPKSVAATSVHQSVTCTRFSQEDSLASKQLKLFPMGDPNIVVSMIQFMQFGYAIALAVVVVFWDDMNNGGSVPAKYYFLVTVVCLSIFIMVISRLLPRYT